MGGCLVGLLTGATGAAGASGAQGAARAPGATGADVASRALLDRSLVICAVAACLPDIDFLLGPAQHGDAQPRLRRLRRPGRAGLAAIADAWRWLCSLASASHVLFDWLGSDDFPPLGVMALWPLSREFYFADAFVFDAISRRYWLPNFITHNLLAVLREIAILLPRSDSSGGWRETTPPGRVQNNPSRKHGNTGRRCSSAQHTRCPHAPLAATWP